jgi:hypothetical protein
MPGRHSCANPLGEQGHGLRHRYGGGVCHRLDEEVAAGAPRNGRETSGRYDGGVSTTPASSMTLARMSFLAAILLAAPMARADGLADLRTALARLQAQTPLKATLDVRTVERHGEGAEATEKQGQASVNLEDGARGLQVLYARDTLARMEAEQRQFAHDPKAKTPTVWALDKLETHEIAPMTSAAATLSRNVEELPFKGEKADTWNGKPARQLSFSIPVAKLPEQQRKYVKEFDGTLAIWIAADGTPLASEMHVSVKGRAFVVVSFDAIDENSATYGVVGDRLLTLRSENHSSSSGAGEHGDQRVTKTLQPQG